MPRRVQTVGACCRRGYAFLRAESFAASARFVDAISGLVGEHDAPGGRVVRHNSEQGFWTLADPAGNEVDVATMSAPEEA